MTRHDEGARAGAPTVLRFAEAARAAALRHSSRQVLDRLAGVEIDAGCSAKPSPELLVVLYADVVGWAAAPQ
jgi:hypothetical protein